MPSVLFFSSRQISAHPIRNFHSSQSTPGRFDNIENAIFYISDEYLHSGWILLNAELWKRSQTWKSFPLNVKKERQQQH